MSLLVPPQTYVALAAQGCRDRRRGHPVWGTTVSDEAATVTDAVAQTAEIVTSPAARACRHDKLPAPRLSREDVLDRVPAS